jgi:hypothetical protein
MLDEEFYSHRLDVGAKKGNKLPVLEALSSIKVKGTGTYNSIKNLDNLILQDKLSLVHLNFVEHNPTHRIPKEQDIIDLIAYLGDPHSTSKEVADKVDKITETLSGDEKYKSFVNCLKRWHKRKSEPAQKVEITEHEKEETERVVSHEPEAEVAEKSPSSIITKQTVSVIPETDKPTLKEIVSELKHLLSEHTESNSPGELVNALASMLKPTEKLLGAENIPKAEADGLTAEIIDNFNLLVDKYTELPMHEVYNCLKDLSFVNLEYVNKPSIGEEIPSSGAEP